MREIDDRYHLTTVCNGWDINDEYQIKGLAMLTEGSRAWRKAPPEMQQRAKEFLESGWIPRSETVASVVREVVEEDFDTAKRRLIIDFNAQTRDNKMAAANDVEPVDCPF